MSDYAKLILKSPLKILYEGPVGRDFLEFNKNFLISRKKIENAAVIRGAFKFSFFFGITRVCDLKIGNVVLKNFALSCVLPNPLLAFSFGKLIVAKNSPKITLELYSLENTEHAPLSFSDYHLIEKSNLGRIDHLLKRMSLVEKKQCEIGEVFLYRSADHRLWQLWKDRDEQTHLEQITQQQWSFDFIEQRELKNTPTNDNSKTLTERDKEYFESLDEDPRRKKCVIDVCNNIRAKGSELCKTHHFELITGKKIN